MAYPTLDAPYGLKPINLIGGAPFSGSTRLVKIASGYATDLLVGDVVKLTTDGSVIKDTGTATATPLGVFLGCQYTNPSTNQPIFTNYWPASTSASDAYAVVMDNPDALFKIAIVSSGTTISTVGRTAIGNNGTLVQNAGSTATGVSRVALSSTTATTNTLPVRIIDVVPDTATGTDAFTEVIVKWNWGMHQYQNATGV
jgi:hypothetical protein